MKAAIMSFTRKGAELSEVIGNILEAKGYEVKCYTPEVYLSDKERFKSYEPDFQSTVRESFNSCTLLVFAGACGIAVRAISPHVRDKRTDPAVICVDVEGKYVIPLLSGHLGGANELSLQIAESIGARAVITTATDLQGVFAVDQWAGKHNLYIKDIKTAKIISALLLDGQAVGLRSDFGVRGSMPSQVLFEGNCDTGICISLDGEKKPYPTTLNLVPRIVYMGVGCKKGIRVEEIEEFFLEVIKKEKIAIESIAGMGTIDLKRNEQGLNQFSAKYRLPLKYFSAEELDKAKGEFIESPFVRKITGVDNVCERAAVLLSGQGKLIVRKNTYNGVAIALAQKDWTVDFREKNVLTNIKL